MIRLDLGAIADINIKDVFQYLQRMADLNPLFGKGLFVREYIFTGAVTNHKIPHNLAFAPKDVILTSKVGSGNVTLNYDQFDETNLDITTDGAVTIRLLVGKL